ncbi:GNAT family N-acetyltransferase [Aquirhabdus parva]|uniref:GNAT family N-acetyltransferase n=1 Tax=Aquirhabdus parva TaxID=2283318 RepID=A0A345P6G5_9GAMM|nr:GNAT family N-acetyltransferase [Aquirhabdus parva]AXI02874.1 GNAT family N-acetyltransferase [Aquirhabdus parva]
MKLDKIRIATLADAFEIATLVNAAYRPKSDQAGWTHESNLISGSRTSYDQIIEIIQKNDSIILVGIHDTKIYACVHIEKTDDHCYIGMLAVAPASQDSGLGKEMLNRAEQFAIDYFSAEKFVMIVLSARHELISFYIRRGYQKTGTSMDYPLSAGVGLPKQNNLRIEVLEKVVALRTLSS